MSSADGLLVTEAPGWRRVAWRTAGIAGAAIATLFPPILLVSGSMASVDVAALLGDQVVDFSAIGLIIALTLHGVERLGDKPRAWRGALLAAGLIAAVVAELNWGAQNFFTDQAAAERMARAGVPEDRETIRLHNSWFTAILATVSALYLLQRRESIEAEQRRLLLEAQWQQARRRLRILHDTAGAARLDPQVLFNCLGLARSEYLRDAASADALLDRLIDFLRASLSATRAGPHTLGAEVDQALRFAAILAQAGGVPLVDAVPPALRSLDVSPGLLLPLVQQWLATCCPGAASHGSPPLCIAAIEAANPRVLRLHLRGPAVAPEALLAESRNRLTDLYAGQATVSAVLGAAGAPWLDIRFELPMDLERGT